MDINLYMVQFDGQQWYVESSDFGGACKKWLNAMRDVWGDDWEGNEQPQQVVLIDDKPVIR